MKAFVIHQLIGMILVLACMTKNVYHGIFQNYTGYTAYNSVFFPLQA